MPDLAFSGFLFFFWLSKHQALGGFVTRLRLCIARARHLPAAVAVALDQQGIQLKTGDGPFAECPLGLLWIDPGVSASEVENELAELRHSGVERSLILASRALESAEAWRLLAVGADDVLVWSDETALDLVARWERWAEVERLVDSDLVKRNLIGRSPAWRRCLSKVVEIARFTEASVLITGESGSGKELVARLIHTLDSRSDKKELIVLDCTTVVPELSGSEFFGHERGAFTNALAPRDGAFALADRGTLFLDEVGDLPLRLQAELLRVIQEGSYKRIGSNTWQRTKFRLISATHRALAEQVASGALRQDFFYRLATWTCELPPLRDRRDDIPLLVRHFLREIGRDHEVDDAVMWRLISRDYPGNLRELRQLVHRIGHRHVGKGPISPGDLPPEERPRAQIAAGQAGSWQKLFEDAVDSALAGGLGLRDLANIASDKAVELALRAEGGNVQKAAKRLGVTDRALQLRRQAKRL